MAKKLTLLNKEYWTNKGYSIEDAEKKVLESNSCKIEFWLAKGYSVEDAEYRRKASRWTNKEYWIEKKGYSVEEAIKKISEINSAASKKSVEKKKKLKTENYEEWAKNENTHKEYWIAKGYSEDEAVIRIAERQSTFTLQKCIQKYGDTDGYQKWEDRQKKWQQTLLNKPLEEINRINKAKAKNGTFVSKGEKEMTAFIKTLLAEPDDYEEQFYIKISEPRSKIKKGFQCDVRINNKIIEYFGDFWHGNPMLYAEDYFNKRVHKTRLQINNKDADRINIIKRLGFDILIIWEHDWMNNKIDAMNAIKFFLKSE